jgi:hypothetical protein
MRAITSSESVTGGVMQAESPEWMPAASTCSMMPATTVRLAVGEGVDVDLDGAGDEGVDQDARGVGQLGVDLAQVGVELGVGADDRMARPPSTYEGRTIAG